MNLTTRPSTPPTTQQPVQPYTGQPSPMPTGERQILEQLLFNSPLQQPQLPVQGAASAYAAAHPALFGAAPTTAAANFAAAALGADSAFASAPPAPTTAAAAAANTSASSSNKVKSQVRQIKNPTDLRNALDNAPLNRHNNVIINQIAKKWLRQEKRRCFVHSNLLSWSITVQIEVSSHLKEALSTHFTRGKFKSQTPADNNTRKRNLALATQHEDKRIIAMANRTLRKPIKGGKKISITYYFKRD